MAKLFFLIGLTVLVVASANVVPPKNDFSWDSAQDAVKKMLGEWESNPDVKKTVDAITAWGEDMKAKTSEFTESENVKQLRSSVDKLLSEVQEKAPKADEVAAKATESIEAIKNKLQEMSSSKEAKKIKDLSEKLAQESATALKKMIDEFQASAKKQ